MPLGIVETEDLAVGHADVGVADADQRIEPGRAGERDAALEMAEAGLVAAHQQRRADHVLGGGDDGVVVEPLGQRDRLAPQRDRRAAVAVEHHHVRLDAIGVGELARRRLGFQHGDGAAAGLVGRGRAARTHQRPGELGEVLALLHPIAGLDPKGDRRAAGALGLGEIVDDGAFLGIGLVQRGLFRRRAFDRLAQHAGIVRRRLAMGADGGRSLRRGRAILQHRGCIARALGIFDQLRKIGAPARAAHRRQGEPVQLAPPRRAEIDQDGVAHQLVAEDDAVPGLLQHADAQAFGQPVERAQHLLEQAMLDAVADHRRRVQHLARRRIEPLGARQHRVAHGARQACATARQDLGDEERIARGLAMQAGGIDRASARQAPHRGERQPRQLDAHRRLGRGEVAHHQAQGRARSLVLAIGQHQQGARLGDAPAEELDQVERRVVGPMDVLDHDQGRRLRPPQHVEHGGEQRRARRAGLERGQQVGAGLARDVVEGPERRRREQRIAMALQRCTRRRRWSAMNWSTKVLLPMPASPLTKAMRPRPAVASANASASTAMSSSRSSRSTKRSLRGSCGTRVTMGETWLGQGK